MKEKMQSGGEWEEMEGERGKWDAVEYLENGGNAK